MPNAMKKAMPSGSRSDFSSSCPSGAFGGSGFVVLSTTLRLYNYNEILNEKNTHEHNEGIPPYVPVIIFLLLYIVTKKVKPEFADGEMSIAVAMIFLSTYVYYLTLGFEVGKLSGSVGPASIPRLWAILLFMFSAALVIKKIKNPKQTEIKKRDSKRTIGLIILMIFYFFGMNYVGFYISTGIFLPAGILWMNCKN